MRNAQVLGQRQAGEGPRQLEAARQPEARALVRRQPVERLAGEAHAAALVAQGAADAVDQGRLARAVGPDQAEPLALLRPRGRSPPARRSRRSACRDPRPAAARVIASSGTGRRCPGAPAITKATISTPATSTLTADEIVTLADIPAGRPPAPRRPPAPASCRCRRSAAWRWRSPRSSG